MFTIEEIRNAKDIYFQAEKDTDIICYCDTHCVRTAELKREANGLWRYRAGRLVWWFEDKMALAICEMLSDNNYYCTCFSTIK